jgi:hypothetical protein
VGKRTGKKRNIYLDHINVFMPQAGGNFSRTWRSVNPFSYEIFKRSGANVISRACSVDQVIIHGTYSLFDRK